MHFLMRMNHNNNNNITTTTTTIIIIIIIIIIASSDGSVAECLACWTQAQQGWVQMAAVTLSVNSFRQSVHTHRASVHQAAKLVAAFLRVARVTVGLAESNGSLPPGL